MPSKSAKILRERQKPEIGKLSFSEKDLRKSIYLNNKIDQAKRSLKQHSIPTALLKFK